MRREWTVLMAVVIAGLVWMQVSAQQEVQSRPGPGSGMMDVRVVNHPAVTAAQSGAWEVGLSRPADVRLINTVSLTRPYFIQLNTSYRVSWTAGESETVRVVEAGGGGWVQVSSAGGMRWINLDLARSIELAR